MDYAFCGKKDAHGQPEPEAVCTPEENCALRQLQKPAKEGLRPEVQLGFKAQLFLWVWTHRFLGAHGHEEEGQEVSQRRKRA